MINLNLLPFSTKRQIAKDIRWIGLANNLILIAGTLLVVSILLTAGHKYLGCQTQQIERISTSGQEEAQVQEINDKMKQVEVIQRDYVKWSRVISNFLKLIPDGNSLHNLQFDQEKQAIFITGLAQTRDDFLNLQTKLEESDLITEIKFPISNLLYQTDINFTLEGKLNLWGINNQ